ncbi:MAG: hypothetical protein D8M59_09135 [Planctomycetes bacterium]|nr:hypothetical protein [Planctomycetota bacterium]
MVSRWSWLHYGSLSLWLGTVGLALLSVPECQSVPKTGMSSSVAAVSARRSAISGLHGVALNVHRVTDARPFRNAIDEIAGLGADSLLIVTPMYQLDGSSSEIGRSRSRCPAPDVLEGLLQYAGERHGLQTALMPIVLLEKPRSNEWRGKIAPGDWDQWWESYTAQIVSFAKLAESAGVDLFFVGSELNSTERMTDRWEAAIAAVRRRFGGALSYSANWDRYQKVGYWEALDVIGVSAWYDVSPEGKYAANPRADDVGEGDPVARAWERIRDQLLGFAESQGRPLLITEIGYPSLPWGLRDPWNYIVKDGDGVEMPDEAVQVLGFEAFFSAWADTDDVMAAGFFCYEWEVGGGTRYGYGVKGKAAETVWQEAFEEISGK